jgi:methionyl-tRNA formyltransferase
MSEALDAGPIVRQRAFELTPETYIGDVYRFATETAPLLFGDVVDDAARGALERRPQPEDPGVSLRGLPRTPADGLLDWTRPAEALGRVVRASAEPFAGAFTFLDGRELVVWRARPGRLPHPVLGVPGQVVDVARDSGDVIVLAADGVLVLEEVQRGSEPRCRPAELITSTRTRLGLDLAGELRNLRASVARLERGGQT